MHGSNTDITGLARGAGGLALFAGMTSRSAGEQFVSPVLLLLLYIFENITNGLIPSMSIKMETRVFPAEEGEENEKIPTFSAILASGVATASGYLPERIRPQV